MGRRSKNITRASVAHKELTARTCGSKDLYVPGIKTTEIPSKGNTYRVPGVTTGRVHHLLSSLEYAYFLKLDFDDLVSDIMEQYLLPIKETTLIAARAHIDPPRSYNNVILHTSTDFLFCRDGVWYARAVKPSSALSSRRTREKLEIEHLYWKEQNVDWKVITEEDLDVRYTRGIEFIRSGVPLPELIPNPEQFQEACAAFLECYKNPRIHFSTLTEYFTRYYGLPAGGGLQIFKHLIISGHICIDLGSPYLLTDPKRCTVWRES